MLKEDFVSDSNNVKTEITPVITKLKEISSENETITKTVIRTKLKI